MREPSSTPMSSMPSSGLSERSVRPTDRGTSTTRNWPVVWRNSRWSMRQSESTTEQIWRRLAPPVLGATMAALALPYTSSPLAYVVLGIFGLAAGAQLGVPSTNGRRFGLPVAFGVAAPIFLVEGNQIDLPSVFVV